MIPWSKIKLWLLLSLSMLLVGCSGLVPTSLTPNQPGTATPAATGGSTVYPPPITTGVPTTTTAMPPQPAELVVWLPPQFDPTSAAPAAKILSARLASFQAANPGFMVEVRIKAASGPGGLLDSLTTTSAAAPGNLPALIALPRSDLETAALKSLVVPLDHLSQLVDDPDWYAYARQLAFIQGTPYGLPFAGDAMLILYRPSKVTAPPADWPGIFSQNLPLAFPAADPQALLTLELYLSAGGAIQDGQGRPTLQADVLTRVLKLFDDGSKQGTFLPILAQYQSDGQAWQAYRDQKNQWLVTWSSRFIGELPADTTAAPLPSLGAQPYTLASGWVWALSEPDPNLRPAAISLAEYLSASDFLAQWSAANGFLPTRPSALAGWSNQSLESLVSPIVLAAQARPSNDLLSSLGPVLQDATLQVIRQQADPTQAAEAAAERLAIPPAK